MHDGSILGNKGKRHRDYEPRVILECYFIPGEIDSIPKKIDQDDDHVVEYFSKWEVHNCIKKKLRELETMELE